jgi:predicted nucleotidyltransferase
MKKIDAIEKLKAHADAIKAMGATSLYLFGSTARDATRATSDLDLFIDYDPRGRFNAFDLVGIKLLLEKELDLPVDVTTRDGLHPMLKGDIEKTAIRVF